jgi:predicted nucleic acid-binding protein
MILVDTSVWIDHFRRTNAGLVDLLRENRVFVHPMVVGELACGSLRQPVAYSKARRFLAAASRMG